MNFEQTAHASILKLLSNAAHKHALFEASFKATDKVVSFTAFRSEYILNAHLLHNVDECLDSRVFVYINRSSFIEITSISNKNSCALEVP